MNRKELLLLSVGVFLTIIAWIIADIYHIRQTQQVKFSTDIIKKVDFKIKKQIFNKLKTRKN